MKIRILDTYPIDANRIPVGPREPTYHGEIWTVDESLSDGLGVPGELTWAKSDHGDIIALYAAEFEVVGD